jgi:hypothetical protein
VARSLSIGTLLTAITSLLVLMLVSVFAISAIGAFNRQREAVHILSVVNITRNTLSTKEDIRIEGGVAHAALAAPESASHEVMARMIACIPKRKWLSLRWPANLEPNHQTQPRPALPIFSGKKLFITLFFLKRSPPCNCPGKGVQKSR